MLLRLLALLLLGPMAVAHAVEVDRAISCDSCDVWNRPQEPFRVFGNTYYVGVAGLSAILIATSDGLILLDGALPQSAPRIEANIRALGFDAQDIRLIVNSHAHFDHAGGIAALQRASNAVVAVSAGSAEAFRQGGATVDDPQYGFGVEANAFPAVSRLRTIKEGERLRVGDTEIVAHATPGHTPGSTTWSWRSCEADRCLDIVYADSLSAVSAPGFRFTGDGSRQGIVEDFRRSIEKVAALPCDILLSPHPVYFEIDSKLARRKEAPATNPFIDPEGCRAYAAIFLDWLERRVGEERGVPFVQDETSPKN